VAAIATATRGVARIVLVRHGRSAHVHDGSWVDAEGVRRFTQAYDAAGIVDSDAPPAGLVAAAASANVIAASDLPRAIASSRRLAPAREPAVTELLRETNIGFAPIKMPIHVWDVLDYLIWTTRLLLEAEHVERDRARLAVEWLEARATEGATLMAVTHGSFRRLLSTVLTRRGWEPEPGKRSYANWSAWSFVRRSP
jgi:broad specificity phosphatase PhoE